MRGRLRKVCHSDCLEFSDYKLSLTKFSKSYKKDALKFSLQTIQAQPSTCDPSTSQLNWEEENKTQVEQTLNYKFQ